MQRGEGLNYLIYNVQQHISHEDMYYLVLWLHIYYLLNASNSEAFDLSFLSVCSFVQRQINFNNGAFPVASAVWMQTLRSFCAEMNDQNQVHWDVFVSLPNLNTVSSWSLD